MNWIILQIENLLDYGSLTINGLLLAAIAILIQDRKNNKKEFENIIKDIKIDNKNYIDKLDIRLHDLMDSNKKLQEEKYQVTREVIPLLIELIDNLNKNEQHRDIAKR